MNYKDDHELIRDILEQGMALPSEGPLSKEDKDLARTILGTYVLGHLALSTVLGHASHDPLINLSIDGDIRRRLFESNAGYKEFLQDLLPPEAVIVSEYTNPLDDEDEETTIFIDISAFKKIKKQG